MKRTIIIHILLLVALAALLMAMINSFINVSNAYRYIDLLRSLGQQTSYDYSYEISQVHDSATQLILYGSAYFIAVLADVAAMVLIAVKEFPVFKPLTDKIAARHAACKEARAAAKAAKAETEKQKRIEQLEAELHSLKKDE